MKTVNIVNRKGGVGKTAVAVHIAHLLRKHGKTLLIDLDYQSHCAYHYGIPQENITSTSAQIFNGSPPQPLDVKGISLLPAGEGLMDIRHKLANEIKREERVAQYLAKLDYDFCVLDTPSDFDVFVQNALMASDLVIVPMQPEGYPTVTVKFTWDILQEIKRIKPNMIAKILITMFQSRVNSHSDVRSYIEKTYPGSIMKTVIPRSIFLQNAFLDKKLVTEYAQNHNLLDSLLDLEKEVIELLKSTKAKTLKR